MSKPIHPGVYVPVSFEPKLGSILPQAAATTQGLEDVVRYIEDQLRQKFAGRPLTNVIVEQIKANVLEITNYYRSAGTKIQIDNIKLENDTLTFSVQMPPFFPNVPGTNLYEFSIEGSPNSASEIKVTRTNLTRYDAPWKCND